MLAYIFSTVDFCFCQEEASEKYWADDDATVTFNDVHVRTLNRVKCSHYLERNIEVIKKDQLV